MLGSRRISAIGTPASPCFRMSTIWLSVKRDFRMGISLAPESLPSKCLRAGEAYGWCARFSHLSTLHEGETARALVEETKVGTPGHDVANDIDSGLRHLGCHPSHLQMFNV